jgi:hypothetical protein
MARLILAALIGLFVSVNAEAQVEKVWEYRVFKTTGSIDEGDLNKFGNDGWELVNVVSENNQQTLIFKKPKQYDNNAQLHFKRLDAEEKQNPYGNAPSDTFLSEQDAAMIDQWKSQLLFLERDSASNPMKKEQNDKLAKRIREQLEEMNQPTAIEANRYKFDEMPTHAVPKAE